jgi:hypothetical protein
MLPSCCSSRAALCDTSALFTNIRSKHHPPNLSRHFPLDQDLAGIIFSVFAQTAGVLTLVQAL